MANKFEVKLISECFVKPKCMVAKSSVPHYLSAWELSLLSIHYMQGGLLYTKPQTCFNIKSLMDKLEHSLSMALVIFYPLAGRLATVKYEDEHACWIYVDSNKGRGARLMYATATDTNVSDIISCTANVPTMVRSLFDLGDRTMVNHDGHTKPLLSVQVTELTDGVFIGFSMNHAIADGTSFWNFVNTLSEIFKASDICMEENESIMSHIPIFKPLLPEGYGPILKLPFLHPDEFITHVDVDHQLRERIFHFSPTSVARLKAQANAEISEFGNRKISSFQALATLAWKSITKARNLPLDMELTCLVIADSRPRFNPPLSQQHFGYTAVMAKATAKVGELLENSFTWATMLLHKAIVAVDENYVRGYLKACTETPSVLSPNNFGHNLVLFGGSTRFDMFGAEFGLGKAVAFRTGYFSKKVGKVQVVPGFEGGGSVDLEVCLLSENMSALESDEEFMNFAS